MQIGLAFLSTAILAVSVTAVPTCIPNPANGTLQFIEVGENTLEAIFYNEATGVRIRANSTSLMLISMANDEVLLSGSRPHNTSLLTSVMGSWFLKYATTNETGEQRGVEIAVPESLVDEMKMAVEAMAEEDIISQLNETETCTNQETAFEQLFARPELSLLESAAHALGNAGIMGYKNQGALNFYGVAMAILKEQRRENNEGSGGIEPLYEEDSTSRFKRLLGFEWCGNSLSICRTGNCPRGARCVGLCGRGCFCWLFACFHCCFSKGCFDHDICCRRHGYTSTECLIPIPFTCFGYPCFLHQLVKDCLKG